MEATEGARQLGRARGLRRWLGFAAGAVTLLGLLLDPALAQDTASPSSATERSIGFAIPAQDLSGALRAFSEAASIEVFYEMADVEGLRSTGVNGSLTAGQALNQLLSSTGLTYRFTGPAAVALEPLPPSGEAGPGTLTLDPLRVEGEAFGGGAWLSPPGYVATESAAGTKTDTPLIETPQSITVITRDRLDAQQAETMADALRYTPGVTGEAFGLDLRGGGLMIRGFSASDTGFYRDGLQVKGTAFAVVPLDPYGAERIDVLRGPASVLFGQGDPGGLVNYVSKRPTEASLGEVAFGFGNFDHYEGRVDIGGPLDEEGSLLYRLTADGRINDTQVDFVEEDHAFVAPALTWKPGGDTTLTLLGQYQYDNSGWGIQFYPAKGTVLPNPNGTIPTNRFTGEPEFDNYMNEQYSLGYLFEHRIGDTWTLRQNARYSHLYNEQQGVFGDGLEADGRTLNRYGDAGQSELHGFAIDNQAQVEFATGPLAHTLLFGLDYRFTRYSDKGWSYDVGEDGTIDIFDPVYGSPITNRQIYADDLVTQRQTGLYLQDQIALWDKWFLILGGRQDWAETEVENHLEGTRSEQQDSAFTGRAALLYRFDMGLAPYVSYSESFLPVLGTDAESEPFEPETGRQYEVGVKYQPPGWDAFITFAAFDITRQNVLTQDPDNNNEQIQTGEVRSRGIELEAVASLDFGLNLIATYTYLDVEITKSNDGNTPYGVPDHTISLWADYTLQDGPLAGLGFGGGVRYYSSTQGGDDNAFEVPGYTLFDAAIHYEWDAFRFAVNASNLFNNEHVVSCFSPAGCFYGEDRTVIGTVAYRW